MSNPSPLASESTASAREPYVVDPANPIYIQPPTPKLCHDRLCAQYHRTLVLRRRLACRTVEEDEPPPVHFLTYDLWSNFIVPFLSAGWGKRKSIKEHTDLFNLSQVNRSLRYIIEHHDSWCAIEETSHVRAFNYYVKRMRQMDKTEKQVQRCIKEESKARKAIQKEYSNSWDAWRRDRRVDRCRVKKKESDRKTANRKKTSASRSAFLTVDEDEDEEDKSSSSSSSFSPSDLDDESWDPDEGSEDDDQQHDESEEDDGTDDENDEKHYTSEQKRQMDFLHAMECLDHQRMVATSLLLNPDFPLFDSKKKAPFVPSHRVLRAHPVVTYRWSDTRWICMYLEGDQMHHKMITNEAEVLSLGTVLGQSKTEPQPQGAMSRMLMPPHHPDRVLRCFDTLVRLGWCDPWQEAVIAYTCQIHHDRQGWEGRKRILDHLADRYKCQVTRGGLSEGMTPLHEAVRLHLPEVIDWLLSRGADPLQRTFRHNSDHFPVNASPVDSATSVVHSQDSDENAWKVLGMLEEAAALRLSVLEAEEQAAAAAQQQKAKRQQGGSDGDDEEEVVG